MIQTHSGLTRWPNTSIKHMGCVSKPQFLRTLYRTHMTKELFIAAHEELIEEYMEEFPSCTWSEAYEITSERAYERMREKMADIADQAKDRRKYGD